MKVSLVQTDIYWEDKARNLKKVEALIAPLSGKTDLVILPEMFTTGFSMNSKNLAEDNDGTTITTIQRWAKQYDLAVCGSHIAEDNGRFYNRGFFISPTESHFYDKKHLFRMGNEIDYFDAGESKLIVEYKGLRFRFLICYDLRFPIWSRNVNNEYDVLIYVASWPISRINAWKSLLVARAIENQSYVCGVNRVGVDGNNLPYDGASALIDVKGNTVSIFQDGAEQVQTFDISKQEIDNFRQKFPAWKDADRFNIL